MPLALKFAIGHQVVQGLLQKPVLIPVQTHLFMEAADERAVVICAASGEVAGNTVVAFRALSACIASIH